MYVLNFWCEHGGGCIWAKNDSARNTFGYDANYIEYRNLPISDKLISKLEGLDDEYHSYLDWEYPPNPSPWTSEHKIDFLNRANLIYDELCIELGPSFQINNQMEKCVQ